jgi:glycosyltransferase involved in cell wall biosynthesis
MAAILREEADGTGVGREAGIVSPLRSVRVPYLSLIIPAYNEEARIARTLGAVTAYLRAQPYAWEVLVVDDGSADGTLAAAHRFARDHRELAVRVIANPHRGKAYAVRSGVLAARGKLIGFTDADLATPIETSGAVIPHFADGCHVVIGSREDRGAVRQDEPGYRHFMGRVFNWLVRIVALPGIQDTQCGFKVLRGTVAHELFAASQLYSEDDAPPIGPAVTAFDVEILFLARRRGYRIASVPVVWRYGTESKVNPLLDSARNFRDVLMVRVNWLLGRYGGSGKSEVGSRK